MGGGDNLSLAQGLTGVGRRNTRSGAEGYLAAVSAGWLAEVIRLHDVIRVLCGDRLLWMEAEGAGVTVQ